MVNGSAGLRAASGTASLSPWPPQPPRVTATPPALTQMQTGARGGRPQAGPKPLGSTRCCGRRIQVPASHLSSHMTHHPPHLPPHFPILSHAFQYFSTCLEYPCLQPGSVRSGGPGPDCVSQGGEVLSEACLQPTLFSGSMYPCTYGPLCRPGQVFGVFVNSRVGRWPPGH